MLLRAGREAIAPVAARLAREQRESLRALCGRGALSLVEASPDDVAGLRAAVLPVYDALRRDPTSRALLGRIEELDSGGQRSETLRCATPPSAPSVLEGVWGSTASPAAMRAAGATVAETATYGGRSTLELRGGRWTFRTDRATVTGNVCRQRRRPAAHDAHLHREPVRARRDHRVRVERLPRHALARLACGPPRLAGARRGATPSRRLAARSLEPYRGVPRSLRPRSQATARCVPRGPS